MKILLLNWRDIKHPEAGGAEIVLHEQAKRWVDWGHDVTLLTSRPEGSASKDNLDGININRAGGFYSVYARTAMTYLASLRKEIDVVLESINGIPFFSPLYCRKPAVGLLHHVHRAQFLVEMTPVLGRIGMTIEHCFPKFLAYKRIICVSKSTADDMQEYLWGTGRQHLEVVNNGIDHDFFSPEDGEFSRPTILYLGRIKKYKRLNRLISFMPAVRKEIPDAELLIAGRGDHLENVKAMVQEKRLGDFIHFLGYVSEEEKRNLYRRSWVLAMPSMNEGWGMNVVEANACGTPCVSYRVPGLKDSVSDGRSGFLVEDDNQFIKSLVRILENSSLRDELSRGAHEWATRYSWDQTARQTLQILEEAALC
jgi:glycosyltransferase involved in cell wall biosynthesis